MNATVKPSKLIKGQTGDWEVVIGLEVHAQVTSNSKLFSSASTEFGGEPNTHVSLVDAAMPGMLPVINEACVRQAVRTGLGLNAQINLRSVFDRKNYFYPDSPQGYQISQYKSPVVGEGVVEVELDGGHTVNIGIERLHLEQDAGKLLHDQSPTMSYVDLNRCGVALMEIVSKPDIRDAEQAKAYVTKLRSILRYLGTCDGDMEKGSLRADVNEDGGTIDQETRLYDPNKSETRSMRSKEEAHDYRYFPDPDLLPLEFSQAYVDELRSQLPELPDQKKARFIADSGIAASEHHEGALTENIDHNSWVSMSVQRSLDDVNSRLQDGLAFLATVGSTAPFVGLFGTVWGIYHAGPVGEALIMTAIGLAVAVPAVLGYNWLVRRNKVTMDSVRRFGADLHGVLMGARMAPAAQR